jgi:exodeoxyribonuclease VIII
MNNTRHIVLDLETLGRDDNACIVAIGAQVYDEETDSLGDSFYQAVDITSCDESWIDTDTVRWWMKQSDAARQVFNDPHRENIVDALIQFSEFIRDQGGDSRPILVWGNGAAFDNVILAGAYRDYQRIRPWSYKEDACLRTLRSLFPHVAAVKPNVAHNALDDAKAQALTLQKLLHAVRGTAQPSNYLTPEQA